jgi:hypothetical protein
MIDFNNKNLVDYFYTVGKGQNNQKAQASHPPYTEIIV